MISEGSCDTDETEEYLTIWQFLQFFLLNKYSLGETSFSNIKMSYWP